MAQYLSITKSKMSNFGEWANMAHGFRQPVRAGGTRLGSVFHEKHVFEVGLSFRSLCVPENSGDWPRKVEREYRFIRQFQSVDGLHPLLFAPCPSHSDTCSSLFLSTNVTVYKRTYLTSKPNLAEFRTCGTTGKEAAQNRQSAIDPFRTTDLSLFESCEEFQAVKRRNEAQKWSHLLSFN